MNPCVSGGWLPRLMLNVRQRVDMKTPRADIFAAAADKLEARSRIPSDKDDPKWLRRNARVFRQWAAKKEKAVEHKQHQKRRGKA